MPCRRIGVTGGEALRLGGAPPVALAALRKRTRLGCPTIWTALGEERMIPFIVVKTKSGFAYLRPEHVVAINATNSERALSS